MADFRALATTVLEDPVTAETKKASVKPTYTWGVEVSGNDFVITKNGCRTLTQLVVMLSQSKIFLRKEKANGEATAVAVNEDLWKRFFNGCRSVEFPENFWITSGSCMFTPTLNFLRALFTEDNKAVRNLINKGAIAFYFQGDRYGCNSYFDAKSGRYVIRIKVNPRTEYIPSDAVITSLFEYGPAHVYKVLQIDHKFLNYIHTGIGKNFVLDNLNFVEWLYRTFGIDCARDYISTYDTGRVAIPGVTQDYIPCRGRFWGNGKHHYIHGEWETEFVDGIYEGVDNESAVSLKIPGIKFDYKTFRNYTIFKSRSMGFEDYKEFFDTWYDYCSMQYAIYGKIKEKYPNNLLLEHNLLSMKTKLMQQEIDAQKFATAVKNNLIFEGSFYYNGKKMLVTVPKTSQEMLDEAVEQSNCLASYVNRVMEGNSIILFLRPASDPDTSYVTVETDCDGNVLQAYFAYNNPIPADLRCKLADFLKKKAQGIPEEPEPIKTDTTDNAERKQVSIEDLLAS